MTGKPPLNLVTILHEDDVLLVLNKPADVVVNRARSVKTETLQDWVEEYLQDDVLWQQDRLDDETFTERSGMVHRLDKDTSGVIVFAKRAATMYAMMKQFKAREIQKTYWALVHGQPNPSAGIIRAPIARHPRNREVFAVQLDGRESETKFRVLETFSAQQMSQEKLEQCAVQNHATLPNKLSREMRLYEPGFALVELEPKTGRTHQIRVHMQYLHHPLVGDLRYVGRKRARLDEAWCPRQWLHARKIVFTHPNSHEQVACTAPVPPDLQTVLDVLQVKK